MKSVTKTLLATAVIIGTASMLTNPAAAYGGNAERMGPADGSGLGEKIRLADGSGEGQGRRGGGYDLLTDEMRAQFRADFDSLSEEEQAALREEQQTHRQQRDQEMEDALGVSREELREAHRNGQSTSDLLASEGVTEADLEAFLTESANERVDNMVEEHSLSEEEKTTLLQRIPEYVQSLLDRWFN